ncbi:serine/threonine protein kinase [Candidatus Woesearchaeota archaeon]|nr:serine/threonine protein kinase [Candidatus Woesearchaeota archaeon]
MTSAPAITYDIKVSLESSVAHVGRNRYELFRAQPASPNFLIERNLSGQYMSADILGLTTWEKFKAVWTSLQEQFNVRLVNEHDFLKQGWRELYSFACANSTERESQMLVIRWCPNGILSSSEFSDLIDVWQGIKKQSPGYWMKRLVRFLKREKTGKPLENLRVLSTEALPVVYAHMASVYQKEMSELNRVNAEFRQAVESPCTDYTISLARQKQDLEKKLTSVNSIAEQGHKLARENTGLLHIEGVTQKVFKVLDMVGLNYSGVREFVGAQEGRLLDEYAKHVMGRSQLQVYLDQFIRERDQCVLELATKVNEEKKAESAWELAKGAQDAARAAGQCPEKSPHWIQSAEYEGYLDAIASANEANGRRIAAMQARENADKEVSRAKETVEQQKERLQEYDNKGEKLTYTILGKEVLKDVVQPPPLKVVRMTLPNRDLKNTSTYQTGQIIDSKYELLQIVGSGGIGVVFQARDLESNAFVAVKLPKAPDKQTALLGDLEAALCTSNLEEGRGVARCLHACRDPPYIVSEFVDGVSLQDILDMQREKRQTLTLDTASEFMHHVLSAVKYVHGKGIVHRDLKPSNILIGKKGQATLVDFGSAHASDIIVSASMASRNGQPFVTFGYVAPELIHPTENVSGPEVPKADVYSLGALFYELLTNQPLSREPPSYFSYGVSDYVNSLIDRMTARRPQDRLSVDGVLNNLPPLRVDLVIEYPSLPVNEHLDNRVEEAETVIPVENTGTTRAPRVRPPLELHDSNPFRGSITIEPNPFIVLE